MKTIANLSIEQKLQAVIFFIICIVAVVHYAR
ncbi:MAG: hypothetical protein JWR50_4170 [Mucilaginibacter sp.]|nr:hypothetical protein [Mucilaginibacter sp.]